MQSKLTYSITKSRLPSLIFVILYIVVFLTVRLINLKNIPVFGDEMLHIGWAQSTADGNLFAGLESGLRLLYIWLLAFFFQFSGDLLLTARVVSVVFGLFVGLICFQLAGMLYARRRLGYWAALFCLLAPFALFHERMAFTDSLLTVLIGVSLIVSIQLWQQPVVKWAVALGFAFGLATLTKGYAAIYYPAPILLWLFVEQTCNWRKGLLLLALVFSITLLAWIPVFAVGSDLAKNQIAHLTVAGVSPPGFFEFFGNNLRLAIEWLTAYLTWPVAAFLLVALILIGIKRDKIGLVLVVLIVGHLLFFAPVFTRWYPRYLLPTIIPISIIFAQGVEETSRFFLSLARKISKRDMSSKGAVVAAQAILLLLLFIPALTFDYLIITAPTQAPFPVVDKWQYFSGPYAGYGLQESAHYIKKRAANYSQVTVLASSFALDVRGMSLYLADRENVKLETLNEFDVGAIDRLNEYAQKGPTFSLITADINSKGNNFVLPNGMPHPQAWQVAVFAKPGFEAEFEAYSWSRMPDDLRGDALGNLGQKIELYQWLQPTDFAARWVRRGGDADPRLVSSGTEILLTTPGARLVDWPSSAAPETWPQVLAQNGVEYVLADAKLVNRYPELFSPFMVAQSQILRITQLPPGWWLAYVHPTLNCRWCLFQVKQPEQFAQMRLGDYVQLKGYQLSAIEIAPGDRLYVTLYWESAEPLPESYIVFIHLIDTQGNLVAQVDELPLGGQWTTNYWQSGARLADQHELSLDALLSAGEYKLLAGMYHPATLERLPVQGESLPVVGDAVELGTIWVVE